MSGWKEENEEEKYKKKKKKKESDEYITRMDAERLVKMPRDNIPAGKKISRTPEKKMQRLNLWFKQAESPTMKKNKKKESSINI